MSIASIKSAIATILATATGVDSSTVHTRRRIEIPGLAVSDDEWKTLFCVSGRVNAWEIEHSSTSSEWAALRHGWDRSEVYEIWGWYATDADDYGRESDAIQDLLFDTIIESIIEQVNKDETLGGTVRLHQTLQILNRDYTILGGRTCHQVQMALEVEWTDET